MDDGPAVRREPGGRPAPLRRASAASELGGACVSQQDGEVMEVSPARDAQPGPDRPSPAGGGRPERRNSVPPGVHQRHMPIEPLKFPIPRKTKENRGLLPYVSTESREYEDMMTILTSSYIDTSSAGCFTYSKPRLVNSELLEKEFVEKRREMKTFGRTDKELAESYYFLLTDTLKLLPLCEKGMLVGQSRITVLGNPSKGVYLSKYSDLLQMSPFTPGTTGEIIIFKVMKGKVKSIYENMKNLLDPTPNFDSHMSKNSSKVTSLTSYRAFELTQHYFYEYSFDQLRQRPRQVCPYAVVSFQMKGKDSPLPSIPLAPARLNSQTDGSKENAQFTVWTGDLVRADRVLFQIALRSSSPPFLPHRLPEKLEIGYLMRLEQVTKLIPSGLFSYNLYNSSQEVVKNGHFCSLLEVVDRNRSTTSVTRLLHELEIKRVVLVTPLTERGFLFLLSSVQMATPAERGESWKRCLQALFVFPESRDVVKPTPRCASSSHNASEMSTYAATTMPQLSQFIPALHHALVKARANPPPELSAGVELQAREYLVGLSDGKVRQYPMGEYESKLDEKGKLFPAPKHHRVNMDGYLRCYLCSPTFYLLSVPRARQMMEAHCGSEEPKPQIRGGAQRESPRKEATSNTKDGQTNTQKMQQLMDLVLTCKKNAENEVRREEGDVPKESGRKRKLEQETAERALKFLKASQEPEKHKRAAGNQASSSPVSYSSVIGSVGLKDVDLNDDGSDLAAKVFSLLKGLNQAASGVSNQSLCEAAEEGQRESYPFDRLASKLGLPTNCDIDLRRQEELEEQTAGSISSLEGFSPSSHSGDTNHHSRGGGGGGARLGRKAGVYEVEEEQQQVEVPWVLIPITGVSLQRYTHRDKNIPQDPRFQHLATATAVTSTTKPPGKHRASSPAPSPPPSPYQCLSPAPSPPPSNSQCPSPDPRSPLSPSQCPSPDPSPPPSPSQCPSPEPSSPPSPSQCPSPQLSPSPPPSQCPFPQTSTLPASSSSSSSSSFSFLSSWCQSLEPNDLNPLIKKQSGANEERLAPTASRELPGVSAVKEVNLQGKDEKNQETSVSASISPSTPTAPELKTNLSPPPAQQVAEVWEAQKGKADVLEERKTEGHVGGGVADECKPAEEEEEVEKELAGSSASSARPHRNIASIVDKHLRDFSSEMQLLLQGESIHYNLPQSPHSTSHTEPAPPQHSLPYTSVTQFSQYVSFYNPRPPVQAYMNSLHDSINTMLDENGRSSKAPSSQTNADATLASSVSAFVASVRAANTGRDEEESACCDDVTAAHVSTSGSQSPALPRGGEGWQPETTNGRNPPSLQVTLSSSVYEPADAPALCPPDKSPQSQWRPPQAPGLGIIRTVTQGSSSTRTVLYTPDGDAESGLAATNCEGAPGFSEASQPSAEPSRLSEPDSSVSSVSAPRPGTSPAPPATALSSLISQLQPEVFNSLVEIIKDVKRNSVQFYLHSTEPEDQADEDVKEHLLKQGNVKQSPIDFLNQENPDNRLLVIIKNKDIAGHIHKIPGLVSLKRHPSVVFVGIDTLDDIRNNSYNELFVSGGCIVSDEFILSPDFITHDRLSALLMILEQHSSPESVWRWKIHCKTLKKLKEQSRFRRDAANILDLLLAYQKRQIVEFLPYHRCDMMNLHSPDLDCLIEHQARYTQYRHTVCLTEHRFEKLPAYSSGGIIVIGIEEMLNNFSGLVGCHDIKDKQPFVDDLLAPKGVCRQLNPGDSTPGSEHSPSTFTDQIHSLSSGNRPQHLPPQPSLPSVPHPSDQLVPDASCKDGLPHPSDTECEVLRMAISQLRAERLEQLKILQEQKRRLEAEMESNTGPLKGPHPTPDSTGSSQATPPPAPQGPAQSLQVTSGRKAVAATLDLIHSTLQPEEDRRQDRDQHPTETRRREESPAAGGGGGGEPGDASVRAGGLLGGNQCPSNSDSSSFNQKAATGQSNWKDSPRDRGEEKDQKRETFPKGAQSSAASRSTSVCSVEGDRSRDSPSDQEQPVRTEAALLGNSTAAVTMVTGSITTVTDHEADPDPAEPRLPLIQQPQQSSSQPPPHSQQQRGVGLPHHPHQPRRHSQHFPPGPAGGPLTSLGGIRHILGPTPVWPGGLGPTGAAAAALMWGPRQQQRLDSCGPLLWYPPLLGGYPKGAGQGGNRYRGGQRGGGFNGM